VLDPKILEKLRQLGINPEQAQWVETQPIRLSSLPVVQRQRELMEKLRDVLKAELEENLIRLDRAREEYERLKNGGGI
jgi:hypothetical protein